MSHAEHDLKKALRWGLSAWLILRATASAGAWFALRRLHIGPTVAVPGYLPPSLGRLGRVVAGPWLRADALWYLKIAAHGYRIPSDLAFYPAFPMLTAALRAIIGNELAAALLVANAACLAGFVLLYVLLDRVAGAGSARAGVFGLAVFPTAFFLVAPYAEPVFLAAACAALVAMLAKRHWMAFAAGLLAAMSRPFGVLICLPMAAIAVGGSPFLPGPGRWSRSFFRLRSDTGEAGGSTWATGLPLGALAALGPVAGLAIWALYAGRVAHDPLAVFHVQSLWRRGFGFFPATVVEGFQAWRKWQSTPYGPYFFSDLAATLFGFGLIAAGIVRSRAKPARPPEVSAPSEQSRLFAWGLAAYGSLSLIAALSSPFPPRPLLSMPRFVLALFPLFGAYGSVHSKLRPALFLLSAAGLFIATAVYVAARPLY